MKKVAALLIAASLLVSSPVYGQQSDIDQWGVTKNDWLTLGGPQFRKKIGASNRRTEIEAAADQGNIDAMTIAAGALSDTTWGPTDFIKAYRYARKAAELGSPRAMVTLGSLLYNGNSIASDKTKAFDWYLKAAELGQIQAMYSAAVMLANGDGVPKDGPTALVWYRRAAASNDPTMTFQFASALWNGVGGTKDQDAAFAAMKIAAEGRHPEAMYWYATWLEYPEISGRPVDETESTYWFKLSAEAGFTEAKYWYARRLLNGTGTHANAQQAVILLRRSAADGEFRAQHFLAEMLVHGGSGISSDRIEARRLFLGISNNPNAPTELVGKSLFNLGVIAELDRQYETARSFYQKAEAAGYINNQNALGNVEAKIVAEAEQARATANLVQRLEQMEKQCNAGNGRICGQLADLYNGKVGQAHRADVPRNIQKSFHFAQKGCALNDAMGCLQVGLSYHTGQGVAKNRNMAIEAYRKAIRLDPDRDRPIALIAGAARGGLSELGAKP